jgi:hypothetical protein
VEHAPPVYFAGAPFKIVGELVEYPAASMSWTSARICRHVAIDRLSLYVRTSKRGVGATRGLRVFAGTAEFRKQLGKISLTESRAPSF